MKKALLCLCVAAAAAVAGAAPADEIGILNEQFGKPGRVAFEKGESGFPVATLTCREGTAKLSLAGGNVFSYAPAGQKEVLYRPPHMPFSTNDAAFVHGGIPVCWPWFNCFDFPGRQIHGFARTSLWQVREVTVTDDFTEVVIGLKTSPETKKVWPYEADVQLTVRLSSFLDLVLKTRNTGKATFALTEGLHAYFYVEDETKCVVKGFKNCYWETLSPNCRYEAYGKDEINLTRGEGRVWGWAPFTTTLVDPLAKRTVKVSSFGKRSLILWNTGASEPYENLDANAGRHFICIEPSTIPHENAYIIPPGRCHELMVTVQAIQN